MVVDWCSKFISRLFVTLFIAGLFVTCKLMINHSLLDNNSLLVVRKWIPSIFGGLASRTAPWSYFPGPLFSCRDSLDSTTRNISNSHAPQSPVSLPSYPSQVENYARISAHRRPSSANTHCLRCHRKSSSDTMRILRIPTHQNQRSLDHH